jgi:hypothetical protein
MFYPDAFNGAWVACPDPIDFRHYTVVNLYDDENAYYKEGPFKRVPRSGLRNYLGHVTTTLDLTGGDPDPATGCLINVTAVRDVQLADDPSSTMTLSLFDGTICNNKGSATFTISAATGVFEGLVVLPGTVRVTLIPGIPADSAQYRATIAP